MNKLVTTQQQKTGLAINAEREALASEKAKVVTCRH